MADLELLRGLDLVGDLDLDLDGLVGVGIFVDGFHLEHYIPYFHQSVSSITYPKTFRPFAVGLTLDGESSGGHDDRDAGDDDGNLNRLEDSRLGDSRLEFSWLGRSWLGLGVSRLEESLLLEESLGRRRRRERRKDREGSSARRRRRECVGWRGGRGAYWRHWRCR